MNVPDQVLAWNQYAYDELIVTKLQPPPVSVLNLAIVHGAVYDAVNAIDGGYEPYLVSPSAASNDFEGRRGRSRGLSGAPEPDPGSRLGALGRLQRVARERSSARGFHRPRIDAGVAVGEAAAAAMILERTGDGRTGTTLFSEGTLPGEWRPVPLVTGGNTSGGSARSSRSWSTAPLSSPRQGRRSSRATTTRVSSIR